MLHTNKHIVAGVLPDQMVLIATLNGRLWCANVTNAKGAIMISRVAQKWYKGSVAPLLHLLA